MINNNHFVNFLAKVIYVISRIEGEAATHVIFYRINNVDYF